MNAKEKQIQSDVYAIFKQRYPSETTTPDREIDFLADIERGIERGADAIHDDRIKEIFTIYMSKLKEFDDKAKESPYGSVDSTVRLITSFFQTQAVVMGTTKTDTISSAGDGPIQKLLTKIVAGSDAGWVSMVDGFVDNGFVSSESAEYIKSYIKNVPLGGIVSVVAILFSLLSAFTKVSGELMIGDYVKKMNSKFTPNYLDTNSLIRALHIAPELTSEINKKIAENGLDQSDIDLLKISNYSLYDVNQIKECYWRKIITKEGAINRLGELGFTPARILEIMSCWNTIPGPQDLFWLVGKEAFEPDQISKFGLGAEFPSEQLKWLEMQGITEEWAQKYWVAHWDYPSEGRVLELFHRGIIDDATLDQFYRLIEITPYWRDKLKQASYSLYTRVDLRRMHDLGIITEQEVYDNFRSEGYDDTHAKNMVKFYIKYNDDNNKDLSKAQIEDAYEADLLTRPKAIEMLIALQYTKEQATFMVEMMDYNETVQMQKLRIKTLQKSYKGYYISLNETRSQLSKLNVETKWIDFYIETWEAERLIEEKIPPKDDIIVWLKDKLISTDDFTLYMRRLHYSDSTIAIYIKQYGL